MKEIFKEKLLKLKDEGGEYNNNTIELLKKEFKLKLSGDKAKDDKKILGAYIKYIIKYGAPINDPAARTFYETVLPDDPGCYWLFARNKDAYVNRVYNANDTFFEKLCKTEKIVMNSKEMQKCCKCSTEVPF